MLFLVLLHRILIHSHRLEGIGRRKKCTMLIERLGRYSDGTVKLNEDDLLNSRHLPVMLIMNMVGEGRFLSVIETRGIWI